MFKRLRFIIFKMFILQSAFLPSAVRTHKYPFIKNVNALVCVAAVMWWSVLFFVAAHHAPAFALFLLGKKTHVYSHPVPKNSTFLSPTISAVSILITSGCYKSRIEKPKPASFIWVIFRHHPFLNSRCCSYSCPIPNNRQYSPEIKPTSIKCHCTHAIFFLFVPFDSSLDL